MTTDSDKDTLPTGSPELCWERLKCYFLGQQTRVPGFIKEHVTDPEMGSGGARVQRGLAHGLRGSMVGFLGSLCSNDSPECESRVIMNFQYDSKWSLQTTA